MSTRVDLPLIKKVELIKDFERCLSQRATKLLCLITDRCKKSS
jgi:hypothetical protein